MVETITLRPIYLEDLALGTGTVQVTLADGSTAALTKINLTGLGTYSGNNTLDFIEQSSTPSTPAANVLRVFQKSDGYFYSVDDAGTEAEWPRTLGTVSRGTWNGTTIGVAYGGTGLTSVTTGDTLYASGANTIAKAAIGTSGYVWTSNGTTPSWSAPTASMVMSGVVSNQTTVTQYCAAYYWVGSITESLHTYVMPCSGVVSSLYLHALATLPYNTTFTVRKNGVDTTLTETISAGGEGTTANDTSHSVTIAAGDRISIKYVSTGIASNAYIGFALKLAAA